MTPSDFLKRTMAIESEMSKAKKMSVDVGIIKAKIGGKIYGDGMTVLDVGTIHEYGLGNSPARSFLRTPFLLKKAEITDRIGAEWVKVMQGKSTAEKSLNLIGVAGTNIAKGAFTSMGYGTWPPIKPETAAAKGSGQTLIDTGTLRNSITWMVNK